MKLPAPGVLPRSKKLGRNALAEVATIATPDTVLRWYRELVAKKYDGASRSRSNSPAHGK
jgi:putative transposase